MKNTEFSTQIDFGRCHPTDNILMPKEKASQWREPILECMTVLLCVTHTVWHDKCSLVYDKIDKLHGRGMIGVTWHSYLMNRLLGEICVRWIVLHLPVIGIFVFCVLLQRRRPWQYEILHWSWLLFGVMVSRNCQRHGKPDEKTQTTWQAHCCKHK